MSFLTLLVIAVLVLLGELALVGALSIIRRLGPLGRRTSDAICRAPLLDVLFGVMTFLPPAVGAVMASWLGLASAIVGQLLSIPISIIIHETIHRQAARGPRLVKAQNRIAGRWRNHAALWFSVLALPAFWIVRIGEILLYPPLRWLLGFPKYRHGDWVNVSRHKFAGLVGHDLIWCLYCDWMTGVWSLGSEMLRNVESFWCPIRFMDDKKCANCSVDFPDVMNKWIPADGSMGDVTDLLEQEYAGRDGAKRYSWFGHPERVQLTVERKSVD